MGRLSRDKRDIFYRLAKERGYRARSAFKLLQIDAEFHIFKGVRRAVDLAAAPGSWSQVLADALYEDDEIVDLEDAVNPEQKEDVKIELEHGDEQPSSQQPDDESSGTDRATTIEKESERIAASHPETISTENNRIIAVDLQPMAPIRGVTCLQGDMTTLETANAILSHMQGNRVELIVCDGAPDVTGLHDIDEYLQSQLLIAAMLISTHVLQTGGTLVAKIFRGSQVGFLYAQLRVLFHRVSVAKPSSSRNSSMEAFVVCQDFKGAPYFDLPLDAGGLTHVVDTTEWCSGRNLDPELDPAVLPFIACGDLSGWKLPEGVTILDADKSYPIDNTTDEYIPPVAPPIDPPYQQSQERQKEERRKRA
jgi:tRNA (cytidine32/guanosine34-2'-O)-methyltransferase